MPTIRSARVEWGAGGTERGVQVRVTMKGALPRLAAGIASLALVAVSAIPVSAQATTGPALEISNPTENAFLRRGRHIMTGQACDRSAKSGSGVDRVQVFIGPREAGGQASFVPGGFLGNATLGLPTLAGPCTGMAKAGWSLKTKSLKKGTWTLFVYARSSVTGKETVQTVTVRVDKK